VTTNILCRPLHRSLSGLLLLLGATGSLLLPGCGSSGKAPFGFGFGGSDQEPLGLFLEAMEWGRLVDVNDQNGVLVEADVLINSLLEEDGINYSFTNNPVTQKETLVILQDAGTSSFQTLLNSARSNLQGITEKGLGEAPPYTMVARNAAIRMRFSEQVKPSTVDFTTIQVFTGSPPSLNFTGRYLVQNDATTGKGFIIFDPTVSTFEAANEGLPPNTSGFPPSADSINPNLLIRIPTSVDPALGQPQVLTSLTTDRKPAVQFPTTEPFDEPEPGKRVLVRAARTGNDLDVRAGFMLDNRRPSLIALQAATVNGITVRSGDIIDFTYTVDALNCKPMVPKVGDVFEVGTGIVAVTAVLNSGNPLDYSVRGQVQLDDPVIAAGATNLSARYTTRYTVADAAIQACYLELAPPPIGNLPVQRIDPNSSVIVRFDEPIDAKTVQSMLSFAVVSPNDDPAPSTNKEIETAWFRQVNAIETVGQFMDRQRGLDFRLDGPGAQTDTINSEFSGRVLFGAIEATDGDRTFTLTPTAGWNDPFATDGDQFVVALRDGDDGIRDLSGNPLDLNAFVAGNDGQNIQITLEPTIPLNDVRYLSLLGKALDEDGDGLAEYSGQVRLGDGGITGREPLRFSRSADGSSSAMQNRPVGAPVNEPLNPAGAVVMGVYRPQEFGFGYPDPTEYNMTIEGLSWSPATGVIFDETYSDISMSLGTASFLPDESFNPIGPTVNFPQSGLVSSFFDDNILGFTPDGISGVDEVEVFRSSYTTRSIKLFTVNGVNFQPWPDFTTKYVWRDTTIPQLYLGGAANSVGSPDLQYITDTGSFLFWAPEQVPSVGLPLLWRVRTFPQANSLGLNQFATTQMMVNGANPPFSPQFRIYSAGGQDGSGIWNVVQPDNPAAGGTSPTGGYQNNGSPTATQGDDLAYWARADFTQEVSRVYTHWFDLGRVLDNGDVLGVTLEPANADQPFGTSIQVEYRGSLAVSHPPSPGINASPLMTADTPFDDYGDHLGVFGSVSTPSDWTTDLTSLEGQGYQFIQLRITFFSNPDLGASPILDGLGIAYQ
jgi:hypothetical protein